MCNYKKKFLIINFIVVLMLLTLVGCYPIIDDDRNGTLIVKNKKILSDERCEYTIKPKTNALFEYIILYTSCDYLDAGNEVVIVKRQTTEEQEKEKGK